MLRKDDSIKILFDFKRTGEVGHWLAVNDNVMGGISKGGVSLTEDSCLLFSGSLSLENNGGFASIRSRPENYDLGAYRGIRIRVMGDGRLYQFRLCVDKNLSGVVFKHDFQTIDGTWLELELPFALFLPTYRGRIMQNAGPLVPGDIRQLGFLIADKKTGPFKLVVDEIATFR